MTYVEKGSLVTLIAEVDNWQRRALSSSNRNKREPSAGYKAIPQHDERGRKHFQGLYRSCAWQAR